MVAPTDFNLQDYRGQAFQGFVQFQEPDGSTWYRLKERQNMTFNMSYDRTPHYSDDGQKVVDPTGHSHRFQMTIKLTSDMFDNTAWTYTGGKLDTGLAIDKKTLSYWIYKNELYEPIEIIFVTSMPTKTGPSGFPTENDVNIKFVLDVNTFSTGLSPSGGVPEITVSGTVLSITSALRSTTTDQ